jgi:hypothetical protein
MAFKHSNEYLTDKVPKKGDQPIIVQQVGVDDDSALDI